MIDKQTLTFAGCLSENLPRTLNTEIMQAWIGNPQELARFLQGLCLGPPSSEEVHVPDSRDFQVWKTVKLGTGHETPDDFRQALGKGRLLGSGGLELLYGPDFVVADGEKRVDLVAPSVGELGFTAGASYNQQILPLVISGFGWKLCPPEVGPQLLIQGSIPVQEEGTRFTVAMEPFRVAGSRSQGFTIVRVGDPWYLHSDILDGATVLGPEERIIFVKPRK